jgi:hypothetical protein
LIIALIALGVPIIFGLLDIIKPCGTMISR